MSDSDSAPDYSGFAVSADDVAPSAAPTQGADYSDFAVPATAAFAPPVASFHSALKAVRSGSAEPASAPGADAAADAAFAPPVNFHDYAAQLLKENPNITDEEAEARFAKDFPQAVAAPAKVAKTMTDAEAQEAFNAAHPGFGQPVSATPEGGAVYDPAANVGRNPDGTIAYVGNPEENGPQARKPGEPITINVTTSSNPDVIEAWLKAHPDDPANHIGAAPVVAQGGLAQTGAGFARGLQNVGETFQNADAAASRAFPILGNLQNAFGYDPNLSASQAMVNRLRSDSAYGDSDAYGVGKFLGEVAPTVPLMMATGGVGGLVGDAVSEAAPALSGAVDFLGGASAGNPFLRAGSLATRGALEGGQAAAWTSGGSGKPLGDQIATGAATGAILNPFLGKVGDTLSGLVRPSVSPELAQWADKAVNEYGIPLRVDQIKGAAGDRSAAIRDSNDLSRPITGAPENNRQQLAAWMKGLTSSYFDSSGDISEEALQANRSGLGNAMGWIARNATLQDADSVMSRLREIGYDAAQYVPQNELQAVNNLIQHIGSVVTPGVDGAPATMSGDAYANLIRKGGSLDKALSSGNSSIRQAAGDIREALDDGFEKSVSPEDAQDFRNLRFAYKNLMTVAKIAPKSNLNGQISPLLLRGALATQFPGQAFRGAGPLGDLAKIGQFMREPPNSNTAARGFEIAKHNALPLLLGAGAGESFFHNPVPAIGAAIGAAGMTGAQAIADGVRGAIQRSDWARNLLLHGVDGGPMVGGALKGANWLGENTALPGAVIGSHHLPIHYVGPNPFLLSNAPPVQTNGAVATPSQ